MTESIFSYGKHAYPTLVRVVIVLGDDAATQDALYYQLWEHIHTDTVYTVGEFNAVDRFASAAVEYADRDIECNVEEIHRRMFSCFIALYGRVLAAANANGSDGVVMLRVCPLCDGFLERVIAFYTDRLVMACCYTPEAPGTKLTARATWCVQMRNVVKDKAKEGAELISSHATFDEMELIEASSFIMSKL